jgi:hypothetical protein
LFWKLYIGIVCPFFDFTLIWFPNIFGYLIIIFFLINSICYQARS